MKIAILYVATGRYITFWKDFYKSCEEFFVKDAQKTYFVFTDSKEFFAQNNENVIKIHQEQLGWPQIACQRYQILRKIEQQLHSFDYVFFFNANVEFIKNISPQEILPNKNEKLTVALSVQNKHCSYDKLDFERNPLSSSYIPFGTNRKYYHSGLFGATSNNFIEILTKCEKMMNEDIKKGIIPIRHDESVMNKYLMTETFKELGYEYLFPNGGKPFWKMFKVKIIQRDKCKLKYGGHNYLRGVTNKKITLFSYIKNICNILSDNKTCYLYFYDGHLSVSPTTISLAKAMSLIFDKVVVFCKNTSFSRYTFQEKNIEAYYVNDHVIMGRKVGRSRFFYCILKYLLRNKFSKKDLFICIDNRPLKYCNIIYNLLKIPFVFLTLELFTNKKHSKNEIQAFKNAKAILIQDDERLQKLLSTYKNENSKIPHFYAPNVSLGEDKSTKDLKNMVSQFKDLPNKIKCASIGMISHFVYSKEISKVFNTIDNAVLIFHDRNIIDKNNNYVQKVIKENQNNLYLSNKVYDFNDIGYVYDGIDIGIATYVPEGNGFDFIGHASGKLTFYLKYKKPVIVNRLEGYCDIIEKYNCGIVIDDVKNVEEWKNAINQINSNYQMYSDNAYKCYMDEFDFTTKIKPFCEFITELTK